MSLHSFCLISSRVSLTFAFCCLPPVPTRKTHCLTLQQGDREFRKNVQRLSLVCYGLEQADFTALKTFRASNGQPLPHRLVRLTPLSPPSTSCQSQDQKLISNIQLLHLRSRRRRLHRLGGLPPFRQVGRGERAGCGRFQPGAVYAGSAVATSGSLSGDFRGRWRFGRLDSGSDAGAAFGVLLLTGRFRCRREGNAVRSPGILCDGREMVKVRDEPGDLHAGSISQ